MTKTIIQIECPEYLLLKSSDPVLLRYRLNRLQSCRIANNTGRLNERTSFRLIKDCGKVIKSNGDDTCQYVYRSEIEITWNDEWLEVA